MGGDEGEGMLMKESERKGVSEIPAWESRCEDVRLDTESYFFAW